MIDLGTLGDDDGHANWINAEGDVVGWAELAGDQTNPIFHALFGATATHLICRPSTAPHGRSHTASTTKIRSSAKQLTPTATSSPPSSGARAPHTT